MDPVYGLLVQVYLIDTMYGTGLFLATSQLPFGIWLMKNFVTPPRPKRAGFLAMPGWRGDGPARPVER